MKAKEEEKEAALKAKADEKSLKAFEKDNKLKEVKLKAPKEAKVKKASKKAEVVAVVEADEEEEADVVKRFEFEGVKYLKSKKTGIIYNIDQDVIGQWNDATQKIDFSEATEEEVEEEYEVDE